MQRSFPEKWTAPELDVLSPMLHRNGNVWTAEFRGLVLSTALQPIYSISHKRTVGYEALIRAHDPDKSNVLPIHLFEVPTSDAEALLLDRLCRYLHIQNYCGAEDQLNWLFLNVSPRVVTIGSQRDSFFGELLAKTGLPPHRIVIEIVEQPTDDAERLRETVAYYRKLGCLTAIDDFGAGHSNFERIWNLSPDIVKLDRKLLTRATEDNKARQILNGIVSLLHQSGCLVLLEGVETSDQAMIAIDAGVDFVQGFYFCRPSTDLAKLCNTPTDFDQLLQKYKACHQITRDPTRQLIDFFQRDFHLAAEQLQTGAPMAKACSVLLNQPTVSRCYLADDRGVQIEDTLISDTGTRSLDPRFKPLESTSKADWYRQQYLKQALAQPGNLHVTAPYLCVTGAYMCVTLSLCFTYESELRVLCCDILANPPAVPVNQN
ncbi:EAL domain-containing protein [Marinobacter sp. 1_MG-2023]|uniref:EAL domain-containing protein n=1 Tax=Marinobacter sp. 1_MG-2023 TaxID=3062627 RepID=UPI0026E23245|nr:EAL domain-containing protein [Marinobacter sp. 1_MG-2023]MDO6823173.1 EAL domain-containing protein [Marinobacter sp. 1_MG-2023]